MTRIIFKIPENHGTDSFDDVNLTYKKIVFVVRKEILYIGSLLKVYIDSNFLIRPLGVYTL